MQFHVEGWALLSLAISVISPLIVGVLTTRATRSSVQVALTIGIQALTQVGAQVLSAHQTGAPYNLTMGLIYALVGFVIHQVTYSGLWKPTGFSGWALDNFMVKPAYELPAVEASGPDVEAEDDADDAPVEQPSGYYTVYVPEVLPVAGSSEYFTAVTPELASADEDVEILAEDDPTGRAI